MSMCFQHGLRFSNANQEIFPCWVSTVLLRVNRKLRVNLHTNAWAIDGARLRDETIEKRQAKSVMSSDRLIAWHGLQPAAC